MKLFLLSATLCAAILLSSNSNSRGEEFLVKDGAPSAQIVVADGAPRTVHYAALELQRYLKKISGAELPISESPSAAFPVTIYVGASQATEKLGLTTEGLTGAGYRIASGENWLAFLGLDKDYVPREPWGHNSSDEEKQRVLEEWDQITGEHFQNIYISLWREFDRKKTGLWETDLDRAGTFNAVSQFLEGLGVRWYMPGEIGEIVPEMASIPLSKIDKTVLPDIPVRNLYIHGGNFFTGNEEQIFWRMRMGLNEGEIIGFGPTQTVAHGIGSVVRRDEVKQEHPDLFMTKGGIPMLEKGVPRLSSEAMVQRNVRYLRKVFDTYDLPVISVMPTDGYTTGEEGPEGQALTTMERGWFGYLSDYVWGYVTKVANELAKTHPDKKIHCLAYTTFLLPPEKIDQLPSNVIVGLARNPSVFHSETLREFDRKLRKDWAAKITSGVPLYQYGYYLHGWKNRWPGVPAIYPSLIVDDLRDLKGQFTGYFTEVFPTPANWINAYVTARFSWDVDLDLEAMMTEYYTLFYGPAKEQMRDFIEYSENNWMNMQKDPEAIDKAFALIETAKAAAGDGIFGQRVALFADYLQPMKAQRTKLLARKDNARKISIPSLDASALVIDGKLDDPIWQELPKYEMTAFETDSPLKTTVSLGWANDNLLVGVRSEEPLLDQLKGVSQDGDFAAFEFDGVEIILETPIHSSYQIVVSALGGILDLERSETLNTLWTSGAEIKVGREEGAWTVEARIPAVAAAEGDVDILNGVLGNIPSADAPWYFNVGRQRTAGGEREIFSLSGKGFHDKLNFSELTVEEE